MATVMNWWELRGSEVEGEGVTLEMKSLLALSADFKAGAKTSSHKAARRRNSLASQSRSRH